MVSEGGLIIRIWRLYEVIETFTNAIELDPKLAVAYNNRGYTYKNLGNYKQAIRNFKIAARLGHKDAQDYLREEGISR
ncbi:MAG: tetratricopeptide repeat protein [Syntrophorhabdaceae bacterium]|jgi:tetratricopeptide (TPR) repeat protein|nr:tetratricopeptide repeat protein [Syntrophorhabdaceae bacterium]